MVRKIAWTTSGHDTSANGDYEAPQGEVEQVLARIWQRLLRVPRVGRRDNFFDLGGHSLTATRMIAYIHREFKVSVLLDAVFDSPTFEALGRHIAGQLAPA